MAEIEQFRFESELNRLGDLAHKAVALGVDQGATQIEVVVNNGYTRSIEIKANSISGAQHQSATGVTVRAYIDQKLGIATATSLATNSVEETVTNAIKLAKLAPPDDNFVSLAAPMDRQPATVSGLFDENLANLDPADVMTQIDDLIQGAVEKHERSNVSGKMDIRTREKVIVNSLGIDAATQSTGLTAYSYISIPMAPTNVGVGFEMTAARNWNNDLDFHKLGYIGAEKAEKMLDAQFAPSKKLPILLDERAVKQSLGAIIGFGVNGFQVMTGTSYFTDKIGAEIGVSELEVWDDPHVDFGSSSRVVDAEGTPTTKVDLVKGGILESYVTDSYTSHKLGLENTGNAGAGFRSKVPRPRTHQLQIKEGSDNKEAMLEDMKEGILIESGFGPAGGSPNISAQINRGFYIKDGEIQYPLKNSMLGTDVFELLNGIQGISKELLVEFGQQSPMILFGEVSIAGAGQKKQGGPAVTMSSF